jgi:hypothetical protein
MKVHVHSLDDSTIVAKDHLNGFDSDYKNKFLSTVPPGFTVYTEYLLSDEVKNQYPELTLKFNAGLMIQENFLNQLSDFSQNFVVSDRKFIPEVSDCRLTHFLCCFNRSPHTSREWAVSWLHHLGWFNNQYCSKHFPIRQHFCHVHPELKKQHHPSTFDQEFLDSIVSLDYNGSTADHISHIQALSPKIQQCFVQLVTEPVAESYYPFPTEKFLYPILNKALWVAYAQPGYYQFIETHMGFKRYQTFDYSFDSIQDPLCRLIAITDMLKPFEKISRLDWHDIYLTEKNTMDYNLELVKSKRFLTILQSFDETQK